TKDAALAGLGYRFGLGPIALVGPGMLMLILAVAGRFDGHRVLVAIAFLCACASCAMCWATPWVIAGAQPTRSGLLYELPGPLHALHLAEIPVWSAIGASISRRGVRGRLAGRWRAQRRRTGVVVALVCITLVDVFLAHGYGYYPVAWAPGLFAVGIATW